MHKSVQARRGACSAPPTIAGFKGPLHGREGKGREGRKGTKREGRGEIIVSSSNSASILGCCCGVIRAANSVADCGV